MTISVELQAKLAITKALDILELHGMTRKEAVATLEDMQREGITLMISPLMIRLMQIEDAKTVSMLKGRNHGNEEAEA